MAPAQTRDADIASLLVEIARRAGAHAAVLSGVKVLGRDRLLRALPLVQPLVVAQGGSRKARASLKQECDLLRKTAAEALSVEPVVPIPLTRVQPSRLIMPAATFLGIWLLIDQLTGFDNIGDVLKSAQWLWVLVVLILTLMTNVTEAISLSGAVQAAIPLGPLTLLRSATDFSGLVGGTAGRTTTIVRFYQRRGMSATVAISSGILYSLGGFAVQIVLAGIGLLFAAASLHYDRGAIGFGLRDPAHSAAGYRRSGIRGRYRLRHPEDSPACQGPDRSGDAGSLVQPESHHRRAGRSSAGCLEDKS